MRSYSFKDHFKSVEKPHSRKHSNSRGKPKSKKMATDTEDMDYESSNVGKPTTGLDHQQTIIEEDLPLDAQYEMIDRGNLDNILKPTESHSTTLYENEKHHNSIQTTDASIGDILAASEPSRPPEITGSRKEQSKAQDESKATFISQQGDLKINKLPDTSPADIEAGDLEVELEQLRREYAAKMDHLKTNHEKRMSEKRRQESQVDHGRKTNSEGEITSVERELYQREIQTLKEAQAEMEGQINTLLNTQEQINANTDSFRRNLEGQRQAALQAIEKEKRAREESELSLRSEIATVQGHYRKEKERAQKFMKTMAEMQSADPLKVDNAAISSSVKGLRYAIKNWARAQYLVPSPPPAQGLTNYTKTALGLRDRGPNYDFLRSVTPFYHEYTNPTDFKFIIQAYIWRRIAEVIFYDDMWAGTRKSLDDEETEYKLPLGYRSMKMNLEPGLNEKVSSEYAVQYHEWRSTSARLIDKRLGSQRRKHTVRLVRDDLLRPLVRACDPGEQDIQNVEDLDAIIEDAMKLAATMASQRADFVIELMSIANFGTLEFHPGMMSEANPPGDFDGRTHYRAVFLLLEPRLVKHGTSEGTSFETTSQLLEGHVETRVVPKGYFSKRSGMGR